MEATKDYTVHIDSKKRVTLRGAQYQYYNFGAAGTDCSRRYFARDHERHGQGNRKL